MNTESHSALRLYNPDWLSDDELVAGFTARLEMLNFLCGELERAPIRGTTHHYLLVGVRGSGKTSMLKRIAVAIRRESRLNEHLIGLSFPEELYEVKGLSDFWWASCRALVDALDNGQYGKAADELVKRIEEQEERPPPRDPHDDAGLGLMLDVCKQIKRRPVLLIDNLDLVLKRIDKSGRKLKNRQSPAYWALREILSTATAPIIVGGSVRLSTPFLGHDDAFYDYFVAQRLGKLALEEVRNTFDHLARNYGDEDLRERIRKRPGRLRALYEMTGGNPRALGLVFSLLRRGPNSSAVDAFEQLLDLTTPYYKARFEELPEQAQVVLHALALSRRDTTRVSYGHKAAVVAQRAGLDTRVVSAQLEMLTNDGVVEKNKGLGERTQYRVAEQLFRLWLRMRSTRRLRQQVTSLTEFLELLFDQDEQEELIRQETDESLSSSFRSRAKLSLALSELQRKKSRRYVLETRAADAMLAAGALDSSQIEGIFAPGDLSEGIEFEARRQLQRCTPWHKTLRADSELLTRDLLGSLRISREDKQSAIERLCDRQQAEGEFARLAPLLEEERRELSGSLSDAEIDLLYSERASGRLALPDVIPEDVDLAGDSVRSLVWKLLFKGLIKCESRNVADTWISWGKKYFSEADSFEWAALAAEMRDRDHIDAARKALDVAFTNRPCAEAWLQLGRLHEHKEDWSAAEHAFRKASELDPTDNVAWNYLGDLLINQGRNDEAESAFRQAIQLYPDDDYALASLGNLLFKRNCHDDAEHLYRKAIEIYPQAYYWRQLGDVLKLYARTDEAMAAYKSATEIDARDDLAWVGLTSIYVTQSEFADAERTVSRIIEIDPTIHDAWVIYGTLKQILQKHAEAEEAFRKAIALDPKDADTWLGLGLTLARQDRNEEAISALRNATELDPSSPTPLVELSEALMKLGLPDEALSVMTRAIEMIPDNLEARAQLKAIRNGWKLSGVLAASATGDWEQMGRELSALVCESNEPADWLTDPTFVEDVLRLSLRRGAGPKLLAVLKEAKVDTIAAPLLWALDAAIDGDEERLVSVEPEARSAAQLIFKQLTTDTAT